jgi:predicted DNA-binding transcriptional regulator YafY
MAKKRTDAERRLRQCERLSRVIRILRLIMGPGRWNADALARELECSRRTVHRHLQALSMAGIPWFYDDQTEAYKVSPDFRFPGIDAVPSSRELQVTGQSDVSAAALRLLADSESFLRSLREFCRDIETRG